MTLSVINSFTRVTSSSSTAKTPPAVVTGSQAGDLLLCIVSLRGSDGAPSPASGWTEDSTNRTGPGAGTNMYTTVFYQYLTGPLSGAQTLDTISRHQWQVAAFLIRGASGVYATDVVGWHLFPNELVTGNYPYTTPSFNTSTNNQLLLCAGHDAEGSQLSPSLLSMSGSGVSLTTNAISGIAADGFGSFDNAVGGYGSVASSGTPITITISGGNNGSFAQAGIVCLQNSAPSTETAAVTMALSGVSFNAGVGRMETAAATLSLAGIAFASSVRASHGANVTFSLAGVAILAGVFDLGTPGTGSVHFSTFGA